MPTAPAELSPARVEPLHGDDELSLAALLDLFEDDAQGTAPAPPPPSPRPPWPGLRVWAQECRRRAAAWGVGPGGAWRAW